MKTKDLINIGLPPETLAEISAIARIAGLTPDQVTAVATRGRNAAMGERKRGARGTRCSPRYRMFQCFDEYLNQAAARCCVGLLCTEGVIMRSKLFDWLVSPWVPEGSILPAWAVAIRWVLFPLDSVYWTMSRSRGYQPRRDIWVIEGVHYTGATMRALANAHGETYRVQRDGETVTLERVPNNQVERQP